MLIQRWCLQRTGNTILISVSFSVLSGWFQVSLRTVLLHTLCSLDALGATRPGLAVMPPSALVIEGNRASSAARANLLGRGLGWLDYRLGRSLDRSLWTLNQPQCQMQRERVVARLKQK